MANYREMFAKELLARTNQKDPLEAQYEAQIQQAPAQNLAPTMSLIDHFTGSKFAGALPKEETLKDKLGQMLQLRQANQQQKLGGLQALAKMQADAEDKAMQRQFQEKMYGLQLAKAQHKALAKPKIGSEDKKALGYLQSLQRDLQSYKEAVKNGGIRPEMWTGVFGDTPTTAIRKALVENYGRLQSGGAISGDEEKRFGALFGNMTDSEEIINQKLARIEQEIGEKNELYGGGAYAGPAARSPSTGNSEDAEAYAWAAQNPDHPLSAQILQQVGRK